MYTLSLRVERSLLATRVDDWVATRGGIGCRVGRRRRGCCAVNRPPQPTAFRLQCTSCILLGGVQRRARLWGGGVCAGVNFFLWLGRHMTPVSLTALVCVFCVSATVHTPATQPAARRGRVARTVSDPDPFPPRGSATLSSLNRPCLCARGGARSSPRELDGGKPRSLC